MTKYIKIERWDQKRFDRGIMVGQRTGLAEGIG